MQTYIVAGSFTDLASHRELRARIKAFPCHVLQGDIMFVRFGGTAKELMSLLLPSNATGNSIFVCAIGEWSCSNHRNVQTWLAKHHDPLTGDGGRQ